MPDKKKTASSSPPPGSDSKRKPEAKKKDESAKGHHSKTEVQALEAMLKKKRASKEISLSRLHEPGAGGKTPESEDKSENKKDDDDG